MDFSFGFCVFVWAVIISVFILVVGLTLHYRALTAGVCVVLLEGWLLLMMRLIVSGLVRIPTWKRLGSVSWLFWSLLGHCSSDLMLTSGP
jgi:hypothetical protein